MVSGKIIVIDNEMYYIEDTMNAEINDDKKSS